MTCKLQLDIFVFEQQINENLNKSRVSVFSMFSIVEFVGLRIMSFRTRKAEAAEVLFREVDYYFFFSFRYIREVDFGAFWLVLNWRADPLKGRETKNGNRRAD